MGLRNTLDTHEHKRGVKVCQQGYFTSFEATITQNIRLFLSFVAPTVKDLRHLPLYFDLENFVFATCQPPHVLLLATRVLFVMCLSMSIPNGAPTLSPISCNHEYQELFIGPLVSAFSL